MLTAKIYINANADCVAENCIKFLLWEERSIYKTIDIATQDALNYFPGIAADFSTAILNNLKKAVESPAAFKKFINSRHKILVRPCYKNAAEYITNELETTLTVNQIIAIVQNSVEND